MEWIRFRIVLPIGMGIISLLLFVWEHENYLVVESMGMAWDTGPPLWPYRAVPFFSFAINAPAYFATWPLTTLIHAPSDWPYYGVRFPAILLLWWWVGTRIDYGFLGRRIWRRRKAVAALFFFGALLLVALAIGVARDEYQRFERYWPGELSSYAILLLRAIGPMLWCSIFAVVFIRSGIGLLSCAPSRKS